MKGKACSESNVTLKLGEGLHAKEPSRFDTSLGRGDTVAVVGMGRLLKGVCFAALSLFPRDWQHLLTNTGLPGWDKGILGDYKPENPDESVGPMALNEKARFKFTP